jgi:bifunctional DNA-binding transcriptional regulator/antitoxin component of YhaV-PrlF toxin-antitoxin module
MEKTELKVTSKGQVTLRRDVLAHLGVKPGDKILVETLPDGRVAMKAARKTGKISDAFGCLKYEGRAFTIEEINDAIERGWAGLP